MVNQIANPNTDEVLDLRDAGDLERDLCRFASRQLRAAMEPRLLQLRRLVIGEAGRFPPLGRLFYDRGPVRTIDALASMFEQLALRGALELDERSLAPVAAWLASWTSISCLAVNREVAVSV